MKVIILLLAVLAMIGSTAAWETTEQLSYTYQKSVNMQAGQDLSTLIGATSSASSQSNTAFGQANTYVTNYIL